MILLLYSFVLSHGSGGSFAAINARCLATPFTSWIFLRTMYLSFALSQVGRTSRFSVGRQRASISQPLTSCSSSSSSSFFSSNNPAQGVIAILWSKWEFSLEISSVFVLSHIAISNLMHPEPKLCGGGIHQFYSVVARHRAKWHLPLYLLPKKLPR